MPEKGGGSGRSSIWWAVVMIMLQVITVLVLVPTTWLEDVIRIEDEMLFATLGTPTATQVEETGFALYRTIFIDTGITDYVHMLFVPTEEERARARGMESLGQEGWFPWIESRGYAIQLVLIQACERMAHVYIWLPSMLLILFPAVWDGYINWQMKRTSLGYSSPFWHRIGVRMTVLSLTLMALGMFLPAPLPPIVLPAVLMVIIPILASIVIANLPKRI